MAANMNVESQTNQKPVTDDIDLEEYDNVQHPQDDYKDMTTSQSMELFEQQLERNLQRERRQGTGLRVHFDDVPTTFSYRAQNYHNSLQGTSYSDHRVDNEDLWFPEPPLTEPKIRHTAYSFLEYFPQGAATLTYNDNNQNLIALHSLDLEVIAEQAPVIAAAFETSDRGSQLHLDLLTPLCAEPFVRYLYCGSYDDGVAYNDVPTSLLLHCQLYLLGNVFALSELRSEALLNVFRQCEFACSTADKPIDLCAALRYCYEHEEDNRKVLDVILNYCVQRFGDHKLHQDQEFTSFAYGHRPFSSDLARTVHQRGFEDESAIDIIRLPYDPNIPACYASRDDLSNPRLQDVVHHFHHSDAFEERALRSALRSPTHKQASTNALTLALRNRDTANVPEYDADASASEDEGFQLVKPEHSRSACSTPTAPDTGFVLVLRPGGTEALRGHAVSDDFYHGPAWADLMSIEGRTQASNRIDSAASSDSEWTLA